MLAFSFAFQVLIYDYKQLIPHDGTVVQTIIHLFNVVSSPVVLLVRKKSSSSRCPILLYFTYSRTSIYMRLI